jgi:hypothetical protein
MTIAKHEFVQFIIYLVSTTHLGVLLFALRRRVRGKYALKFRHGENLLYGGASHGRGAETAIPR